jgi:hypothetical protein
MTVALAFNKEASEFEAKPTEGCAMVAMSALSNFLL